MLNVSRHLFHEFLFVYLSFLPDTDVIMTLVQYFVCCIIMKRNVWHCIEQLTIDASMTSDIHDSKHACAEGGHFKHMTEINLCRKKPRNDILREHLP